MDVIEHVANVSRQRIARWTLKVQRNEVAAVRVDFSGIDDQDIVKVAWRIGDAGAVAVIGQDDEIQAGAGCGRCIASPNRCVRSRGVHVPRPTASALRSAAADGCAARGGSVQENKNSNGGHDDRRCQCDENQDAAHGPVPEWGGYSPARREAPRPCRAFPGEFRLRAAEVPEGRRSCDKSAGEGPATP
jgi:hypothetical protein